MRYFLKITGIIIFVFLRAEGNTQPIIFAQNEITKNNFFVSAGLEPELISSIGYLHFVKNFDENINFYCGGSLKLDPLIISKAWRSNFITATDYKFSNHWGTTFMTSIYLAHTENRAGLMNGLGFELRSSTVNYNRKWSKGFVLGWQFTAFTHIKNSDEAKNTFTDRYTENDKEIEGPKDGWYAATASRFRLGFVSSARLNNHLKLQLGIGSLVNVQRQGIIFGFSHAQIPFYFESLLLYRL